MTELTLVQRRIAYSLECITQLQTQGNYGKYVSYVKSLPAAILMNGLGQASATLLAQAKGNPNDPHKILYNHIDRWLCSDFPEMPYRNAANLLVALTANGQGQYIVAQAEALFLLDWLKKFAVAFLDEGRNS
jgi:CRISPR-associated protein Cmr5